MSECRRSTHSHTPSFGWPAPVHSIFWPSFNTLNRRVNGIFNGNKKRIGLTYQNSAFSKLFSVYLCWMTAWCCRSGVSPVNSTYLIEYSLSFHIPQLTRFSIGNWCPSRIFQIPRNCSQYKFLSNSCSFGSIWSDICTMYVFHIKNIEAFVWLCDGTQTMLLRFHIDVSIVQ